MKLYLANGSSDIIGRLGGVSSGLLEERPGMPLRVLISYHYFRTCDLDELFGRFHERPRVFADSGAYSAQSLGARIDLKDYCAWLKRWAHWFTTYANLDVIGDAEATDANQRRMEDAGFSPLPAFHIGEPFSYLEDLCERYGYIGLGGMVGFGHAPMKWLVKCFRIARDSRMRSVFHGYGVNSVPVLRALPFYSADATSWGAGFTWGRTPVWDERARKMHNAILGDAKSVYAIAPLIRSYGYDPQEFALRERNDRSRIIGISAASYRALEDHCTRRHGDVLLPEGTTTGEAA